MQAAAATLRVGVARTCQPGGVPGFMAKRGLEARLRCCGRYCLCQVQAGWFRVQCCQDQQASGPCSCLQPPSSSGPLLWVEPNGASWQRGLQSLAAAVTAAKSLQSCPTLCDPIDGSPPGSPVLGILQARTLEWVAISFSRA